ncbi:klaroid protein-like [Prorops nasuta]|uniref:klaroid protein-like n=1 Tax=Prorops nasuta TaxID=863751 RepID=UPI0034CE933B
MVQLLLIIEYFNKVYRESLRPISVEIDQTHSVLLLYCTHTYCYTWLTKKFYLNRSPMSARNVSCCGSCPANSRNYYPEPIVPWYSKIVKPLAFCIITSLLAMSVSHVCDKFSVNSSFKLIKADLRNMREHLSILSLEVQNMIETRDELRTKLKEIVHVIPKISEAISDVKSEVAEAEMNMQTRTLLNVLSSESVREVIKSELQIYDADKTGRTDFALKDLGGSIITTRNTELYEKSESFLSYLGIPICEKNGACSVIQNEVVPGNCWSFKGSSGTIVLQLAKPVFVSGVSIEHIAPTISPTGETSTAPREFSVWKEADKTYEIVEITFHSNSGNREYTCIYRIRVHGTLS